jgi:hypothetical protein
MSTSLCSPGFSSSLFSSEQGVPQGFSFSPILLLFYNADLIDIGNSPDLPATSIGYVDDTNVLAFGKSTEETCSVVKDNDSCCLTWGDMHGAYFASHKYVLVHFPKKKRNLPLTPLELLTFTLHPSSHALVLGLILDSKLFWHPHFAHIKTQLRTQTFALTRLTSSAWGAPLSARCLLYTSIVCPAINYASTAWYSLLGTTFARKYFFKDLMSLQNNCLKAISGAYTATPIRNLAAEAGVPPLGIYLDSIQAQLMGQTGRVRSGSGHQEGGSNGGEVDRMG